MTDAPSPRCSSGTMTLREQAYRLADNLEGYANKCVHIGSPETVGDLLDAAVLLRTFTVAQRQQEPVHGHGYAIVPLTPTPRMVEIGCDNNPTQWNEGTPDGFAADVANDVYVSMVRAAGGILDPAYAPCKHPHLGLATTRELLAELSARVEIHATGGLDYRTVDGEAMASTLPSTNSCSAATKHSGTFLGYRDEHGNEMHCAHAFCPHQAKCRKGCINPVAVTSTPQDTGAK